MLIGIAVPELFSGLHRSQSVNLNSASDVVAALFVPVDYIVVTFKVKTAKKQLRHRALEGTVLTQWCHVGRRCLLQEHFEGYP